MTNKEAISWLSNETSAHTIREYERVHGKGTGIYKVREAIDVAVAALKRTDIKRVK